MEDGVGEGEGERSGLDDGEAPAASVPSGLAGEGDGDAASPPVHPPISNAKASTKGRANPEVWTGAPAMASARVHTSGSYSSAMAANA